MKIRLSVSLLSLLAAGALASAGAALAGPPAPFIAHAVRAKNEPPASRAAERPTPPSVAPRTTPTTASVAHKQALTMQGAERAIAAAVARARALKTTGVVAVVDEGGNLMALSRIDGTFAAGANISIGKARTAALFNKPTRVFEEIIKGGRTPMVALQDFTPLQGGVPIVVGGSTVGGIGVSGAASAAEDEELALAGAGALALSSADAGSHAVPAPIAPAAAPTFLPHTAVDAAFDKGIPLLENASFKVHASRRELPGSAEVHLLDTDIAYVREGNATLVTGGTMTNPRTLEQNEVRGDAIVGGETRELVKGDVVVIPRGVPHWFKRVSTPFTYFVVKAH
jgi:uncharacterized protein GlcG (DUF336 family)/mannose-6-phosphate isomerase-like protein (cupin superfamily)